MAPEGPLAGLEILDLSSVVLGPMTAQYLGDMGADVIKIEPPEGDVTRLIGPRRSDKMGALYLANNRNKRSLVLDLKRADAQAALRRLVERSDVLLHSIRTPAATKLGLDYETLSALNPRLVFCHMLGFSDSGVYAGRAAYDDIVQALSGLAMLQKVPAGAPRYIPSILADKTTAVHAAYAIMLALFARERTGRGQKVGVPMFETMVAFTSAEHLGGHIFEPPIGEMGYTPVRQGMRRPFKTQDGYLCFMPYTDEHWRRFIGLIDAPEIAADPRFMTMRGPTGQYRNGLGGGRAAVDAANQRRMARPDRRRPTFRSRSSTNSRTCRPTRISRASVSGTCWSMRQRACCACPRTRSKCR